MRSSSRLIAAAVGGLVLLSYSIARAQTAPAHAAKPTASAAGWIAGSVQDEHGGPVAGATVSARGATTATTVTDCEGRYELRSLPPGPYLFRVIVPGYIVPRGKVVDVRANTRTSSSLTLRRVGGGPADPGAADPEASPPPVLAAGVGAIDVAPAPTSADDPHRDDAADDDHSEVAWRLRHARRGVLRDIVVPTAVLAGDAPQEAPAVDSAARGSVRGYAGFVANLLAGVPLTGQFNLLTSGSFDNSQQLFAGETLSRGIADVSLTASVGDHADWSVRGALTQGDVSSWFVAGVYSKWTPGHRRYDVGLSYSTQRYDGGTPIPLRSVADGSRAAGAVFVFDSVNLTPSMVVSYGARVDRYDYLANSGLVSPRVEVALSPAAALRVKGLVSSRALAPGAEEFLPPSDVGQWLPPQRTFSSFVDGRPFQSERTNHAAIEAERDLGPSTVSFAVFRQQVTDQLVTMFGARTQDAPGAQLGHYLVGNSGDVDASGWSAKFRTAVIPRVNASVVYTLTKAQWTRNDAGTAYLLLIEPSLVRPTTDRLQEVSTSIEANVPETATRVLVICRLMSGLPSAGSDRSSYDSRFDMQVHQSLPFMDFSTARWEMLLAIRNTFRDATSEASVYDELLVARPPKRIIGGLTLKF